MKTAKQLERCFKGLSNHHRLDVLILVGKNSGITVEGIAKKLDRNFSTISVHTQKMVQAGLLDKTYMGRAVAHSLSPYGKKFLKFVTTF